MCWKDQGAPSGIKNGVLTNVMVDVRGCYDPVLVPNFFVGLNVQNEIWPYNPLQKTVSAFESSTLMTMA